MLGKEVAEASKQEEEEKQERLLIPQMMFYFDVDISDFIYLK